MNGKIDIMLYVSDVVQHSQFWQRLGLSEVGRTDLGETTQINLATSDQAYRLSLFDIDFIKKMSPEVAEMRPSLMFFTDDFDAFVAKAEQAGVTLLPEREQMGCRTRAFADPDGNYFAIADQRY